MVPLDLDSAIDDLYGQELDAFVGERNRVAAQLRKEGRRAEAARVKELRKPSLSAWAVNQLARRRRKDVDLLLDAGHRLASAQTAVLSGGDPERFDEARRSQNEALKRLRGAAAEVLGDRASPGTLERVSATLRAAAVSDEGRELLARGRVVGDVETTGFEAFAGLAPTAGARAAPRAKSAAKPPPRTTAKAKSKPKPEPRRDEGPTRAQRVAEARAALSAARDLEADAVRIARDAEKALRAAQRTLEQAERDADAAEADRRAAGERTVAARQALDDARKRR